jgi:isochorismate synthase
MSTAEEFFEKLQVQLDNNLPFVAYRIPSALPGSTKAFLQKDDALHITEHYLESGFVFAPFDDNKDVVIIPQEQSTSLETKFKFSEAEDTSEKQNFPLENDEAARELHKQLVQQAVEKIISGAFKKVVLSRKESLETVNLNPLSLFKKLLQEYATAYVYCWYHPKVGLWMGATPETLLEVERNRFKTMSLAGTQKYNGTTNVTWGEKEIREQKIVTDSILENLLDISIDSVETTLPYTARAGNLLHLKTDISGQLSNSESNSKGQKKDQQIEIGKLISAIHPTPAVCGLPKESAKQFILQNENYHREFYTGFLGELNIRNEIKRSRNTRNRENQAYATILKTSALYVNLRCMKLEENKVHLYIGGGITKDSDPDAEWEETKNKSQTMKAVL